MKLSKDQILFIDKALADAGFMYHDIRYEVTDHIAAALEQQEGDFNTAFTSYVAVHGSELFKIERQFVKIAMRKTIIALCKNLLRPWAIISVAAITTLGMYAHNFYERADVADMLQQIFYAVLITTLMLPVYKYFAGKPVYTAVAKAAGTLGLVVCIGFPSLRLHRLLRNSDLLFTYHGLLITVAIALLITVVKLERTYKLRYHGI
jgi:hypothetical protein